MNDQLPTSSSGEGLNKDAAQTSAAIPSATQPPDSKSDPDKIVETTFRIRNRTPKRLTIEFPAESNGKQTVVFPPLAESELKVDRQHKVTAIQGLVAEGRISAKELTPVETKNLEGLGSAVVSIAIGYFIFSLVILDKYPAHTFVLRIVFWAVVPLVAAVAGLVFAFKQASGWTTLLRVLQQAFSLLLVLVTSSGLAAATIYYFGGGQQLLRQGPSFSLLGRVIQFTFIAIASLLPALLYFLFDRNRLGVLRTHFEQQIFRFDPTIKTLDDVYAKYGGQLDEIYGHDPNTAKGRHTPGTRWPIWICTLVITVGWILTLPPVDVSQIVSTGAGVREFLSPDHSSIVFGFLGAYYFAIFSISRRYTRGDLHPKAYSHIVVRILVVFIMAWVIDSTVGVHAWTLGLIFVIGVLPDTFWTVLNEFLRNQLVGKVILSLKEKDPLTNLEGIDPYDRARLAEEGVTNVQSLANHDLIDLILSTRIPVPRLVDWLDQAILYLHVPNDWYPSLPNVRPESDDAKAAHKTSGSPLTMGQHLKTYGIRTATDFIKAYEAAQGIKAVEAAQEPSTRLKALFMILDEPDNNQGKKAFRLQVIYDTLLDDEWLCYIQHWRQAITVEDVLICVDLAGRAVVVQPATKSM